MVTREMVHRVLQECLPTQRGFDQEEFDTAFDDVYTALHSRFTGPSAADRDLDDNGLPFDVATVSGTLISTSCLVAMALTTAAIKAGIKSVPADVLEKAERTLIHRFGNPELVRAIRQAVERIVAEL